MPITITDCTVRDVRFPTSRALDGRYMLPAAPGYSITMKPESLRRFSSPDGASWRALRS